MGVKLDIEAWFVGTKDTIKREGYGALPGRIGGLVRDARAFYFDEPVVGMVDFGYKEGKGRKGRRALVTGDGQLGSDFSMYDSSLRYAAKILSGEIKGNFREAIEQAKQWKKIEEQILQLKEGETFNFLTPKGLNVEDGVAFTTVKKVGSKFELTSRLLPKDINNEKAKELFREVTKENGEIVIFGNTKNKENSLFMGAKGIETNVRSKDFEGKLNKVIRGNVAEVRSEKTIDVRILPVVKDIEIFTPLILTRTVSVNDFKIERLQDFVVVVQRKGEDSVTVEVRGQQKARNVVEFVRQHQDELGEEKKEITDYELRDFSAAKDGKNEERGVVVSNMRQEEGSVVDGATDKQECEVLGKTGKARSFQVERVLVETRQDVGKVQPAQDKRGDIEFRSDVVKVQSVQVDKVKVEVKPKIGIKISVFGEEMVNILKKPEVFFQLIEDYQEVKHQQKVRKMVAVEPLEITDKVNDAVTVVKQGVIQETGVRGVEVQAKKEELSEESQSEESEAMVKLADVVERVVEGRTEAVLSVELTVEPLVFPEEVLVNSGDGVVDYGRNEVVLEISEAKAEKVEENGVSGGVVIFDARKSFVFGEFVISEKLLKEKKVYKIPKVRFGNQIFSNELWDEETGRKMMLDTSFSSGQTPSYLTLIVPAVLFWLEDLSLSLN